MTVFSLLHAFLLFFNVIVLVRIMMPARYVLLNPYAATLDNLLARLLTAIRPAFQMSAKPLCGLLLALSLCADAVMLSRMNINAMAASSFILYALPVGTFKQWLFIAVLTFFRHLLTIFAATLVFQLWHRSKTLPGYSGDLLRLATYPLARFPLAAQWALLIVGNLLLAALVMVNAESVSYPFEALKSTPGMIGELASRSQLSALVPGARLAVTTGLFILDVFSELHGFTTTLILFAILSLITRNQSLAYFIKDLWRLFRGPLPEFRVGMLYLTPVLILLVLAVVGSMLPAIFLTLVESIAKVGGWYVV